MNVLVLLKLGTANAATHLTPLLRCDVVDRLHVVREQAVELPVSPKVQWHEYGQKSLPLALVSMFRTGFRVLRQEPIDYVIAVNPIPYGMVAWLLAKLFRKPISLSLIGDDFNVHCKAWYGPAIHAVLRNCDSVTGTGQSMIDQLETWGIPRSRLRVLPHSIDTERFSSDIPLQGRQTDVLYVGDLVPLKRIEDILRALVQLQESHPGVALKIAGDGPEAERLRRTAQSLGIDEHVTFVGREERPERLYADSRIFVLASEREGLPLVLVEAMCCGCVPVSSRCGSVKELIQDGENGRLFDVGDWRGLATTLSEIFDDPREEERLSANASLARGTSSWTDAEALWTDILGASATDGGQLGQDSG